MSELDSPDEFDFVVDSMTSETAFGILTIVIFMACVVGLAALLLWIRDKWTLSRATSQAEKQVLLDKSSARLVRGWVIAQGMMAAVSIPLNVVGVITKSVPMRIIYIGLGSLYVLACWDMLKRNADDLDDAEDD